MKETIARRMVIFPLVVLVSSCGGGGSGSGSAPPVTVTPTPAPAPAPTPSPTPTQYDGAATFDRNMTFQSPYVEVRYRARRDENEPNADPYVYDRPAGSFDTSPIAATLTWNADKSATVRAGDYFRAYPATLLTAFYPEGIAFSDSFGSEGRLLTWGTPELLTKYVAGAREFQRVGGLDPEGGYSDALLYRYFMLGSRTQDNDLPVSGAFTYKGYFSYSPTTRVSGDGNQIENLSIDLSEGRITGSWMAGPYRLDLHGTISRSDPLRLSGSIEDFNGLFRGSFVGNLYGPQAKEIGILLFAKSSDFVIGGAFLGARP